MLCLLWVPRPDDRRDSFKHNPADAHDALPPGSLNPSKHSVEVLRLLWVPRPDDRRESFKHNPADADDALPPGSLNPSKHSVEVLHLLWVPRPDDRRVSFTHNPADAHDALHGLSTCVQSFGRSAVPTVGSKARRSEREF